MGFDGLSVTDHSVCWIAGGCCACCRTEETLTSQERLILARSESEKAEGALGRGKMRIHSHPSRRTTQFARAKQGSQRRHPPLRALVGDVRRKVVEQDTEQRQSRNAIRSQDPHAAGAAGRLRIGCRGRGITKGPIFHSDLQFERRWREAPHYPTLPEGRLDGADHTTNPGLRDRENIPNSLDDVNSDDSSSSCFNRGASEGSLRSQRKSPKVHFQSGAEPGCDGFCRPKSSTRRKLE